MTLREAWNLGKKRLTAAEVPDADLDAWYLLEWCTGVSRSHYLAYPDEIISHDQEEQYRASLVKRERRIPLQQITGEQEFMGLSFYVNEHVLIPRQDTEILVEETAKFLRDGMQFLDLCTGSGCILLSLLHLKPGVEGTGVDLSPEALKVAEKNRERLGAKAALIQSDLFDKIESAFDVIVSNPPYIKRAEIETLMDEVRLHEPYMALDGHEDGLYFYRKIAEEAPKYLRAGGGLFLEIGCDQGACVAELLRQQGFADVKVVKDLAGLDRVVEGFNR
ncbi:peptide chain release factor N(5)-glutamine methyltransferase [Laedolimicola intestinihominis]|mgnify:CR=1 FL=1|uniref:Release factor glutamine methyltransferase n=1 Tax=Laedolimicola intestinihominis TaxID=3133166 RepID=A0ABV1FGG0_9FIRM|nr:peptide chain release factor N(5)-glutamine methyltransferase [Lachnospiraceae bacterium]MBD9156874.1 peptide chain release factor N(5)-glutamine methyltransferase [Lachnospiraceae bacterium]